MNNQSKENAVVESDRETPDAMAKQIARVYGEASRTARCEAAILSLIARVRAEARQTAWQPIAACPKAVTRALLYWPAFNLDEDGNLTTEPAGEGLVSVGYRVGLSAWEEMDPALEATGEFFGDDWEYGEPTQWMPLPDPPARADAAQEERP